MQPRLKKENYVIGPDGSPLTLADLPKPSPQRWVVRRKAEVVAAVRGGLLSLEEHLRSPSLLPNLVAILLLVVETRYAPCMPVD